MPNIHILRPGTFQDANGVEVRITEADIEQIARDYRPHSAPLIVGHSPATADPAHGWAASLSADARGLHAAVPRVTPEMERANREGRYRRCSSRLVRDGDGWRLDHIGMLGARTPAVSGLDPVELAAGDDPGDVVIAELELAAHPSDETDEMHWVARWLRRVLGPAGDAADTTEAALAADGGSNMTESRSGADRRTDPKTNASESAERVRALESQVTELRTALAAQRQAATLAAAQSAVHGAVEAGRLLPRDEAPMTAVLAALETVHVDGEPLAVELAAEDGGEATNLSAADYLRGLLGRLPVQVPQGEIAGSAAGIREPRGAAPDGAGAARLSQRRIDRRARELILAKPDLSYGDAAQAAAVELAGAAS